MIRLPEQAEVWDVTKEGSWSEELTLPAPRGEFGLPDYSRYGEEMIWEAIKLYLGGDFDFESEFFATFKPWLVKFVRAGLTLRKGRALVEEDGLRDFIGLTLPYYRMNTLFADKRASRFNNASCCIYYRPSIAHPKRFRSPACFSYYGLRERCLNNLLKRWEVELELLRMLPKVHQIGAEIWRTSGWTFEMEPIDRNGFILTPKGACFRCEGEFNQEGLEGVKKTVDLNLAIMQLEEE